MDSETTACGPLHAGARGHLGPSLDVLRNEPPHLRLPGRRGTRRSGRSDASVPASDLDPRQAQWSAVRRCDGPGTRPDDAGESGADEPTYGPLGDQRRWHRYQHLFAGFLRERLRRENPAVVSRLHQKAGEWHESNGTTPEAVGHALAAGDFERAGVMIEGLRDSMTTRGELPALVRMVKSLPQEVLRSRPNLCDM